MTLFLVASPIGNRSDLSPRAIETLAGCDLVAAEDTRRTGRLLRALGIEATLISFYEEVEARRQAQILEALEEGRQVALISDAGTPCISDPGFKLVRTAIEAGHKVVPIPGPSAVLTALVASGLPTDRFRFEGFLHRSVAKRRSQLEALLHEEATTVFFEAPTRLAQSLDLLAELLPDRDVVVARELTKLHEEFIRGTAAQVAARLRERQRVKGEVTLVVAGRSEPQAPTRREIERYVREMRAEGLSPATIRNLTARLLGVSKKQVFDAM